MRRLRVGAAGLADAWQACVVGDVAGCLERLRGLPDPAALDAAEQFRLDRTVDDLSALLPARLASAAGMACEAACLSLLRELSDRGLFPGVGEYEALGVALMTGLIPPLLQEEIPEALLALARDRARGDPDMAPVFAEVLAADSLASFVTAFLPAPRVGSPGNSVARLLSTVARALSGSYGESDTGIWLENGLRLAAAEAVAGEDPRGSPDPRAMIHVIYHRESLGFRLACLDREERARTQSIDTLAQLARSAAQADLPDEAWFLSARIAALTGDLAPDAPEQPENRQVQALAALERCERPGLAPLADLVHVGMPVPGLPDGLSAASQRCWNAVRKALAALGSPMPAASRWRASCSALGALGNAPLFSILDEARWQDPESWALALLPLFRAHPFPWRHTGNSRPGARYRLKAVTMSGSSCTWDVNSGNPLTSTRLGGDILTALWRQPTYRGIRSIGPDNIMTNISFDLASYQEAGLFPVVRAFNKASRDGGGPFRTSNLADVVVLASTKLDQVYEALRGHDNLVIDDGELVCAIGALRQFPWEYHRDPDLVTAFVCLDPQSTGLAAVDVPPVAVTPDTRLAVFADERSLARAEREVEAIRNAVGHDRVEAHGDCDSRAFEAAARSCDILHVSAHGTQTWQDARRNELRFPHGTMSATDIAEMDLSGVALVFLNSCDAAAPGPWGLAGDPSMVGALIAAGASAVVAALWSVEESCAEVFSRTLYGELSSGCSLPASFRQARRQLRRHAAGLVDGNSTFLADAYRLTLRGFGLSREQAAM